eukprot:scaffold28917_cov25-Prasinocladus_malaysianus.AAC.1
MSMYHIHNPRGQIQAPAICTPQVVSDLPAGVPSCGCLTDGQAWRFSAVAPQAFARLAKSDSYPGKIGRASRNDMVRIEATSNIWSIPPEQAKLRTSTSSPLIFRPLK